MFLLCPWCPLYPWRHSVPQRLASLQCVLDALQCLALSAELEKSLALEVEEVLLAYHRLMRQRASREHTCERPADYGVVIGDAAGPPREMDAKLQRGLQAVASDRDGGARHRPSIPFPHALDRERLRVGHQPVAIHRDAAGVPEKPEAPRIGRARRHSAEADCFEDSLH